MIRYGSCAIRGPHTGIASDFRSLSVRLYPMTLANVRPHFDSFELNSLRFTLNCPRLLFRVQRRGGYLQKGPSQWKWN